MLKPKRNHSKKRARKAGLPPGSLQQVSTPASPKSQISYYFYDHQILEPKLNVEIEEAISAVAQLSQTNKMLWINVDGHGQPETLKKICEAFSIHPLVLEDIITTGQRPKTENYDSYSYIVLQACSVNEKEEFETEQISLVLGTNFLLSFQEKEGDAFKKIAERLANDLSRLRSSGVDYLAYTILDGIVDNYFSLLERFGDKLEELENEILATPKDNTFSAINAFRKTAIEIRRAVWPLRELLITVDRLDSRFISQATKVFLRDVYSHVIEIIDTVEIYREMLGSLIELYLSSLNARMNEVIKVLTIITTIFMPLTFIAGVYGMNFEYMPELKSHFGYPLALTSMLLIAMAMFMYFKRKDWL